MNLTIEQLENIYNYIANRSNKDTSFPFSSYEDLNMFTGLNKENKNVLFKKEIIDDKFNTIVTDYNYKINGLNNLLQSEITDIKDNYIKKGNSNQTFILDNGERQSAIIDVDDEVEYNDNSINISLISSNNDELPTIHLNSATNSQAGLMSAVDKKKLDNAIENDGDASISSINNIQYINGNNVEGLNIHHVNGIESLQDGKNLEFWNTNGSAYNIESSGLTTNGDIVVKGNNTTTTITNKALYIYNNNNAIELDGEQSKITLRQLNSTIELYAKNNYDLGIKGNISFGNNDNNSIFNLNSLYGYTNEPIKVYSILNINKGFKVADNQEASFGSRGILLNNGGIDFKYSDGEAHLVHTKSLNLKYNGVACKENFYVKDNIYIDNVVYANSIDSHLIDHVETLRFGGEDGKTELTYDINEDVLEINSNITVFGDIRTTSKYIVPKECSINFLYGNPYKETQIKANTDSGYLIIDNGIDIDGNINATKFISSSTTDKVTDSTSISNTDIVVSQNGNNNSSFNSTLDKNSLTINSEDGFNGTFKAVYGSGTLSVSHKEDGATYTQSTNLDENSISFVKTKDSGSKTTKALWIDNNDEFNFTGANVNFNKEINAKSDVNFYGENIYFLGKSKNGKYDGCHLWFRDGNTQNDTSMFMLNDKFTISHETSAPQVYPFILDPVNSNITLKDASKNSSNYDNSVYTPNTITINSKINTDDLQGTSETIINNLGYKISTQPKDEDFDVLAIISSLGIGYQINRDDNNYSSFMATNEYFELSEMLNGNKFYDLKFANDGITIDYKTVSTLINKNDKTLNHKNYNKITIENTDTSANKDIDIKNYDILINDNSRLGFKYNNEIYIFNAQKAIELGLLTKV